MIVAKDVAARERLQKKLEKILADDFPSAISRVHPLALGPPVSWPVQYRVSGPEISQVREIALELAKVVATSPQATMVHFDWIEPARQVRIRVDQDEARLLGLSSQALASVLNTVISGSAITQVRDDIYLIDVVVRATDEQRVSVDTLRTVQVPLPSGRTVPLSQFATFDYQQEYPLDLATRSRSDADRAGQCRAGSPAGGGGPGTRPCHREVFSEPSPGPTGSPLEARSRRVKNRWHR